MILVEYVARVRGGDVPARFCWAKLKKVDHFENLDLCGSTILKYILSKLFGTA
jgi:hypothetical protein